MANAIKKSILGRIPAAEFIGRELELGRLLRHAAMPGSSAGLLLSAAPGAGTSELLRQAYDRIFSEESEIVPVYFSFDPAETDFEKASRRFVRELVTQVIAFGRPDREILIAAPEIDELTGLAAIGDAHWIEAVFDNLSRLSENAERESLLRVCFGAPVRAGLAGVRLFVMIDGVHNLRFCHAADLLPAVADIMRRAGIPFVVAGRRRFFDRDLGCERYSLEQLSDENTGKVVENLCRRFSVAVNESTRDLIVHQFAGNLRFAEALARRAKQEGRPLTSFRNAESIYAAEIFGGEIGKYFDDAISAASPDSAVATESMELIFQSFAPAEPLPASIWQSKTGLAQADFEHFTGVLNDAELINASARRIEPARGDLAFADFIEIRHRLGFGRESRTLVFADMLAAFVKRAPEIMAKVYRTTSAIGLRDILRRFDGQKIPAILFDYGRFKSAASGVPAEAVEALLRVEEENISLPNAIFAANTEELYPPIGRVAAMERSAAVLGFVQSESGEDEECVWLTAEIENRLEADAETAAFWCDRLEMAAAACNFDRFQLWLIANEGFSSEALEILNARRCFSSSRRQAELIRKYLRAKAEPPETEFAEYEFTLPMGDEAELIAAHTLEEIARTHGIDLKSINQIKTALIEACINAAEHGMSPDGKLHQHVRVGEGRIELTVSNRGIRLADRPQTRMEPKEGRRGWGLNLMRRLMDEVQILRVDDGTTIQMTKKFAAEPAPQTRFPNS